MLDEMTNNGFIESAEEAQNGVRLWVIFLEKSGDIRICINLFVLNKNVEIEYFPMASFDYTLNQFNTAKLFNIFDEMLVFGKHVSI